MNKNTMIKRTISENAPLYVYRIIVGEEVWANIMNDGVDESEDWFKATNIKLEKHSWHTPADSEIDAEGTIATHILLAEATLGMPEGAFLRVEISEMT